MEILFALIIIMIVCSVIADAYDNLVVYMAPFWQSFGHGWHSFSNYVTHYMGNNIYLIMGGACVVFSIFHLVYFKPHKAERYFKKYAKNIITRQEAITKIADTLYKPSLGVPSALNSKLTEKRIMALRKRVKAEEAFIRDLKNYIITKET